MASSSQSNPPPPQHLHQQHQHSNNNNQQQYQRRRTMHGASGGRAARQGRMNGARVMSKVHVGLWSQQRSFQHAWAVIASAMRARDVRRELNQVARLGDARAKAILPTLVPPEGDPKDALMQVHAVAFNQYDQALHTTARCIPSFDKDVEAGVDMFTAAATLAALYVVSDTLLQLLVPFESCVDFWNERQSRPILDAVEAGPPMWWTSLRHTLLGGPALPKQKTPRGRLQQLAALTRPLEFKLGVLKRAMLSFKRVTDRQSVVVAIHGGMAALREALLPPSAPLNPKYRRSEFRLHLLFNLLALDANAKPGSCRSLAIEKIQQFVKEEAQPLQPRSFWKRHWVGLAVVATGLTVLGYKYVTNKEAIYDFVRRTSHSFKEFYADHVRDPATGIWDELFNADVLHVSNKPALDDATVSLQTMLRDYLQMASDGPAVGLPREKLNSIVRSMDASIVSRAYEKQIQNPVRNAVAGDLVQLMLIQIQFIKRELMVAMESIDKLLQENQFNLQVMATIPAILITLGSVSLVTRLYRRFTQPTSTKKLRRRLRLVVRDIDRLLLLSCCAVRRWDHDVPLSQRRMSRAVVAASAMNPRTVSSALQLDNSDDKEASPLPVATATPAVAAPVAAAAGADAAPPTSATTTAGAGGAGGGAGAALGDGGADAGGGARAMTSSPPPSRSHGRSSDAAANPSIASPSTPGLESVPEDEEYTPTSTTAAAAAAEADGADGAVPKPVQFGFPGRWEGGSPSESASPSPSSHDNMPAFHGLSDSQLGRMVLLLARLNHGLREFRAAGAGGFTWAEWRRVEQDVRDLGNEELEPWQRAAVLERMYRTHAFLQCGAGAGVDLLAGAANFWD